MRISISRMHGKTKKVCFMSKCPLSREKNALLQENNLECLKAKPGWYDPNKFKSKKSLELWFTLFTFWRGNEKFLKRLNRTILSRQNTFFFITIGLGQCKSQGDHTLKLPTTLYLLGSATKMRMHKDWFIMTVSHLKNTVVWIVSRDSKQCSQSQRGEWLDHMVRGHIVVHTTSFLRSYKCQITIVQWKWHDIIKWVLE